MMGLSVILITHNAERTLSQCLESVVWADEIIVVDSGSTDDTSAIAATYTKQVHQHPFQGFGLQKQAALQYATQDWVLSVDADEVLDAELQQAIKQVVQSNTGPIAGYRLAFQSYFCGHPIRFGDWRSESHLRLFQRRLGQFSAEPVHESLAVAGEISTLPGRVHHHSYPDWDTVLDKMQRYSSLGAQKKWAQGKRANTYTALGHSAWAFLRGYVLKLGFLDGMPGLLLALSRAEETRYRYLKLRDLDLQKNSDRCLL